MSEENLRDVAAERAVVAAALTQGLDAYLEAADLVSARTLTDETNQVIWECVGHLFKGGHTGSVSHGTLMSAAHSLKCDNIFDDQDQATYLRALCDTSELLVKTARVRPLAIKLGKLEIARRARSAQVSAVAAIDQLTGDESMDEILSTAESPLAELVNEVSRSDHLASDHAGEGVDEYLEYVSTHQCENIGLPTPYLAYNEAVGGLPPGVSVIAARPKMGKSSIAINVILYVCERLGLPGLYIDTEMDLKLQRPRILANLSGVAINDIRKGVYANNPTKRRKVHEAAAKLKSLPFSYRSVVGRPFEEIMSVIRRWVHRKVGINEHGKANLCVVIFDYLNKISKPPTNKNLSEYHLLSYMTIDLHNFMSELDIPCLAMAQLNKEMTIAGTDRIIWTVNSFATLEAQTPADQADHGQADGDRRPAFNRKLVVSEFVRHGAGMEDGDFINLTAYGSIARILDGPRESDRVRGGQRLGGRVVAEGAEDESLVVERGEHGPPGEVDGPQPPPL